MSRGGFLTLVIVGVALLAASEPSVAQTESQAIQPAAEDLVSERARRERELAEVQTRLRSSEAARSRLAAEIDAVRQDSARVAAVLVETGQRAQRAENRIRELGERLDTTVVSEAALRRSLEARRETLANVLGALQRMGRHLPPALLVRPDDTGAAIRSAMLLGAVLPELRSETEAVATDIRELARLRGSIADQRGVLQAEFASLAGERERLAALVEARQRRLTDMLGESGSERQQADALAREAGSLQELVRKLDGDVAAATERERRTRERFAAAAAREPIRLAPRLAFADARGTLPVPVAGTPAKIYGDPDGLGGSMRGATFATRPGAVVTAACDGWISYAGPFRSLGRLLIINAGEGYYVVLAGLNRVSVDVGQFVLAGEPIGQMGETATSSAALGAIEADGPVLYVEFRKDGGPIDPAPWWAARQGEKVRG